jgi:hypothetical protein
VSAVKIVRFLGVAPKNASELLPDTAAQVARNCKLYSGDLIPYPAPVIVGDAERTGVIKTLYGLRDPNTDQLVWLTWTSDVNIVTPAIDEFGEQRFYYTGDGIPKVSTYDQAVQGVGPYPVGFYELGLPLPTVKPTTTATAFTPVTTASFARSAGNNVTLVTGTPHNLKSGTLITVSGFSFRTGTYSRAGSLITVTITGHGLSSGADLLLKFTSGTATSNSYTITVTGVDTFTCSDTASGATSGDVSWDIGDLNTTAEVTVINATTIRYFSFGPEVATTSSTAGKIDLGGQVQARNYLYTWFSGWEEESIGSEPADALFIKEGQIVTVGTIPTVPPAGNNFIRGIRLYRTLSGVTDAEYFRLATLWFPNTISGVSRSGNISTVTFIYPHQLSTGDRFKISGCSVSSFDIVGGIVTSTNDLYTLSYAQAAANVTFTTASGTLYYDVSENPPATAARYWGDGGVFTFTDDFDYRSLSEILSTNDYDAPPGGLRGLTIFQNSILAGFEGNALYLTEPGVFHAWPEKYKRVFDSEIVGLAQVAGSLLVLTKDYPYIISGSNPAVLTQVRLSSRYPCLNARSIAETSFGVVYATHDGLAIYAPSAGAQILTRAIHSSDTWNQALDPNTLVGTTYKGTYIAAHSNGSIVFEPGGNQQNPGTFVDSTFSFSATWYDPRTNALYVVSGLSGDIYQWDNLAQPALLMQWKSKTLVAKDFINPGAARVVADYTAQPESPLWDVVTNVWVLETGLWNAADAVIFKLYANKTLVATIPRSNSNVFRLPTGYRTDTFEVEVESAVRIRAIHFGDTPTSLRTV